MKNSMAVERRTLCLAAAIMLAAWTSALASAFVEMPDGRRIEGTSIRARRTGEIVLMTPAGTRTFQPGQYARAVAPRPSEFDRARQLAAREQYDEAITMLRKIVTDYYLLEWDIRAQVLIAQVQGAAGQRDAAVATFEDLFRATPRTADDADIQRAYKEALLRAGRFDRLAPLLDKAVAEGSREEAARAQIMRGDMLRAQDKLDLAALDYLRTVILFERQTDQHPEALFKAGEVLEALRDNRAGAMFERLVKEYPASPYAERARDRM